MVLTPQIKKPVEGVNCTQPATCSGAREITTGSIYRLAGSIMQWTWARTLLIARLLCGSILIRGLFCIPWVCPAALEVVYVLLSLRAVALISATGLSETDWSVFIVYDRLSAVGLLLRGPSPPFSRWARDLRVGSGLGTVGESTISHHGG